MQTSHSSDSETSETSETPENAVTEPVDAELPETAGSLALQFRQVQTMTWASDTQRHVPDCEGSLAAVSTIPRKASWRYAEQSRLPSRRS